MPVQVNRRNLLLGASAAASGLLVPAEARAFSRGGNYLANAIGHIPAALNMTKWGSYARFTNFRDAYWGFSNNGASISSASFIAPDGSATGQKLVESANNGPHAVGPFGENHPIGKPAVNGAGAVPWRMAAIVKAAERTRIVLNWGIFTDANASVSVGFDLAGGNVGYDNQAGTNSTISAATMRSLGNGWWLCYFDWTYNVSPSSSVVWTYQVSIDAGSGTSARNASYVGNGSSGVLVWWLNILPVRAWSFRRVFDDHFDTLGTIDLDDTRAEGFNWYIHNTWPDCLDRPVIGPPPDTQQPPASPDIFSLDRPSVLRIYNPNNNVTSYTSMMMTAAAHPINANDYVGNAWGGPLVFDGFVNWDSSLNAQTWQNTNLPAFWSESIEFRINSGLNASGNYLEVDTTEDIFNNSANLHSYECIPSFSDLSRLSAGSAYSMFLGSFVRVSSMWITMAGNNGTWGEFLFFANGTYIGDQPYSASFPSGSAYAATDDHRLPLILITAENTTANVGGGFPFYVDRVSVYQ